MLDNIEVDESSPPIARSDIAKVIVNTILFMSRWISNTFSVKEVANNEQLETSLSDIVIFFLNKYKTRTLLFYCLGWMKLRYLKDKRLEKCNARTDRCLLGGMRCGHL